MVADPRSYMTYQPLLTEPADVLEHPRQDFLAALRVIATGPSHQTSFAGQDEKEDEHMLTTGEQQQLCRIGQELRDADRGFAWRLGVRQGMLRWARPGRQAYLLALAVLAAALLCLVAAARRLLVAFAGGADGVGGPDGPGRHRMAGLGLRTGARSRCQSAARPAAVRRHGCAMSGAESTDGWVRACSLADLDEDQPVHVDIGECPVCLVRVGVAVYALRADGN
jgi:hypothetical protein